MPAFSHYPMHMMHARHLRWPTHFDILHVRADPLNRAGQIIAGRVWRRRQFRVFACAHIRLDWVDAGVRHTHQHLRQFVSLPLLLLLMY
jgi:hypothetical protein